MVAYRICDYQHCPGVGYLSTLGQHDGGPGARALRGRYFGARGMIMGFITQVFFYLAGGILTLFSSAIFTGYAILFAGATVFRLLSLYFLSRMYEPAQAVSREKGPSLLAMIKNMGSSNLGKFILYFSLIDFCTLISGPFFTVFHVAGFEVSAI